MRYIAAHFLQSSMPRIRSLILFNWAKSTRSSSLAIRTGQGAPDRRCSLSFSAVSQLE